MGGAGEKMEPGAGGAQHFVNQDEADIADQEEGGVCEDRKFFDEPDAGTRDEAEREDAEEDPGANDPEFWAEGDSGDNIIHAQAQVHDFDRDDRPQEPAFFSFFGREIFIRFFFFGMGKMLEHQVEEIGGTEDFQPGVFDDACGKKQAKAAEKISADDAQFEGEVFLFFREVVGHRGDC